MAKLVKNPPAMGLNPGLGRSLGKGKDYPLQYSDLENSMDCIVQGVAKSRTRLSDFHCINGVQSLKTVNHLVYL